MSSTIRFAPACVLLLLLVHCLPCEGRKLLPRGGEVMHFEGGLVLRVAGGSGGGETGVVETPPATATARFSASGRAERLMRSVPSPGVGH
uniref:Uncharacterized protein n=1 Tax=Leersia perrieri TaxID=77586 RepID=A0A0D9WIY0_9ORYZ